MGSTSMKDKNDKSGLNQERLRLSQERNVQFIRRTFRPLDWVPVYLSGSSSLLFGSLVPSSKEEEVVNGFASNYSWPGLIGSSGFLNVYDGVEPIVLHREFHGVRPSYQEICEEFRTFHNLFHDRDSDSYVKIDDAGAETVVAVISQDEVRIRMKELTDFLAEKDMYLCLGFEYTEVSDGGLDELGIQEGVLTESEYNMYWVLGFRNNLRDASAYRASSQLRGIRFIRTLGDRGSTTDAVVRKYQDFIVGLNEAGEEVTRSCNPDTIYDSNGVEGYLTPVVFNQAVLDNYASQPSKYSVDAYSVRCGGLWHLRFDNDRDDGKVVVHLGDLANLPTYEEQSYWRAYNVASDAGLSETAFRSQVLAEPTTPSRIEYRFQAGYSTLGRLCDQYLGWQLLIPLHSDDTYRLSDVRVPANNEQKAFDDFVGNLHNVLIDSLNSKQLADLVPNEVRDLKAINGKSISLLEEIFKSRNIEATEPLRFLRELNDLRNKADGHRKGSHYVESLHRFGVEADLRVISQRIMDKAVNILAFLSNVVPALR